MITDERLRWISGPDYIASEPGQIAAELLTARARIRELEASLASYQAARVHDVDEKGGLSKRVSELEAALELQKDILAKYHKLNCSTAETAEKPLCDCAPNTCRPAGTHNYRCRNYFTSDRGGK